MSPHPNDGPRDEKQRIAQFSSHITLSGLFYLLTTEKTNAFGSATYWQDEFHAFSVNPPKMLSEVQTTFLGDDQTLNMGQMNLIFDIWPNVSNSWLLIHRF